MSDIQKVVLIGASGNLGPAILNEFLKSKLTVSVLSRPNSSATFPSSVNVIRSSYDSAELTAALKGQNAVISLVGNAAFDDQQKLIDAAIAAGVKRFVPSEFGSDTGDAKVRELVPIFEVKRKVVEYLKSKERDGISWTALITGPFCDWGLKIGFLGFNTGQKSARIWDDGTVPFCTTNLSTIGAALVAMLTNPRALDESANKYIYIASHVTTQSELLGYFEKVTGSNWSVTKVKSDEALAAAQEKLGKGDYSAVPDLILAATYGPDKLGLFEPMGNELLELPSETLEDTVRAVVERKKP